MATLTRSDRPAELARLIGEHATVLGVQVAVVESLTGGLLSTAIAEAPGAAHWYAGGIVPYARHVKHSLLEVPAGPVVGPESARAMAARGARILSAEYAVSLTGVGGPTTQDGHPPGTVFLGLATPAGVRHRGLYLPGAAHEICRNSVRIALAELERELAGAVSMRTGLATMSVRAG